MRRHTADVQARRQDGGAGRALRHLGDPVGKFFPLKILAGILYFPVPGVEKKKKLPVPRVTEISTVHLFISNLTRAVWGLPPRAQSRFRHIFGSETPPQLSFVSGPGVPKFGLNLVPVPVNPTYNYVRIRACPARASRRAFVAASRTCRPDEEGGRKVPQGAHMRKAPPHMPPPPS